MIFRSHSFYERPSTKPTAGAGAGQVPPGEGAWQECCRPAPAGGDESWAPEKGKRRRPDLARSHTRTQRGMSVSPKYQARIR